MSNLPRALRSRRDVLSIGLAAAVATCRRKAKAEESTPDFSLPIGLPGRVLGDGFLTRHGYATENTWYNPGWLHTGEDYYLADGDTAGVNVYAVADGEVVFAGSEYPGLVVIVQHDEELFSMYGHLGYDLEVEQGDAIRRGQRIGSVLERTDGRAPSHLHFEMRTFLTRREVNGDAPRYSVGCSFNCEPGPGYWPIDDPAHPSEMGWLNPTHVIADRSFDGQPLARIEAIVPRGAQETTNLWTLPANRTGARQLGPLPLRPGDRYGLRSIAVGPEASDGTSAEAYRLWYEIVLLEGGAWVQAAVPSDEETGSDGRPSSIRFNLLPLVEAD